MAMHWFVLSAYRSPAVFLFAGIFAALFAWSSFNLVQLAMANLRYLGEFGRMALFEGGLRQQIEIAVTGYLALAFYLGFKACETELVHRWRSKGAQLPTRP
jgi:hypothetical protein